MNELPEGTVYDLIIIGGGPAGLMAAKTAATEGLRVVLVEKKRNITEINRTCAQAFFSPGVGLGDRFYSEAVNLENFEGGYNICYPHIGLKVPYHGPISPSYQLVYLSPSGYAVKRYRDDEPQPWATIFSKKALLAGLLDEVSGLGVNVMVGATALAVENRPAGVKVLVRYGIKEVWFEAEAAIAADGLNSVVVEYFGLNKSRGAIGKLAKGIQWVMEGISPQFPLERNPCFMIAVPSLGRGTIMVGPFPEPGREGLTSLIVTSSGEEALEGLKLLPQYNAWFRQARLVKRTAYTGRPRTAITKPALGRVLIIGDAAAAFETLMAGALACGYKAGKAILPELDGKSGYREYTEWWLEAFHFHEPDYYERLKVSAGVPLNALCSDAEIDYLYSRLSDRRGDPAKLVLGIMDVVRNERLELYGRLVAR
ncbi:MAG: FAD-dependent monooxygenase [Chloroflexota bacterium]